MKIENIGRTSSKEEKNHFYTLDFSSVSTHKNDLEIEELR